MQNQVCGKNVSACKLPIFAEPNTYILENEELWHDTEILCIQLKYVSCITGDKYAIQLQTECIFKHRIDVYFIWQLSFLLQ